MSAPAPQPAPAPMPPNAPGAAARARARPPLRLPARLLAAGVLAAGMLAAGAGRATADEFGLDVSIEAADRLDPAGGLSAGRPITVDVTIRDPATGRPMQGLRPVVWLRRLDERSVTCSQAAQQYWATGEHLPRGSIATRHGLWLVTLDAEGRIAVHDPALNLATANMLAVRRLPEPPAAIALAQERLELWASLPSSNALAVMPLPDGEPRLLAQALSAPGDIVIAGGHAWVAENGTGAVATVSPDGALLRRHAAGPGPLALSLHGQRLLARAADGSGAVLDTATGRTLAAYPAGALSPGARLVDGGVADMADDPPRWRVRYDGRPDATAAVATRGMPDGMQLSADGLHALVWDNDGQASSIDVVDVATATLLHRFESSDAVAAVVFSGHAAFVAFARDPRMAVVDLAPLASGGAPAVRDVDLPDDPGRSGRATPPDPAPLGAHAGVLAARAGSRTLAVVMAGGGLSTAQMGSVVLKSDPPERLLVADRSLREIAPGRFAAVVRLQHGGEYRIVATTGVGGTTACRDVTVEGAREAAADAGEQLLVSLSAERDEADRPLLEVRVAGREASGSQPPRLVAASLSSGRTTLIETARRGGHWVAPADLPGPDTYVFTIYDRPDVAPSVLVLPASSQEVPQ